MSKKRDRRNLTKRGVEEGPGSENPGPAELLDESLPGLAQVIQRVPGGRATFVMDPIKDSSTGTAR